MLVKELQSLGIEVIAQGIKVVTEEEVKEITAADAATLEAAKEALGVGEVGEQSELAAEYEGCTRHGAQRHQWQGKTQSIYDNLLCTAVYHNNSYLLHS